VAAQRKGNAGRQTPSYLRTAEVADLLYVSPKTVSRWAKEGKLPFMKTLGGHRRYPEAKIRELVDELQEQPTAERPGCLRRGQTAAARSPDRRLRYRLRGPGWLG
jgi:excisionase family DNA binding protein